jgi:hypothetical protein
MSSKTVYVRFIYYLHVVCVISGFAYIKSTLKGLYEINIEEICYQIFLR